MIATIRRRRRRCDAARPPLGESMPRGRRTPRGPLDRAVVGVSHLGRGGLIWLALAPLIGHGRRALSRREATLISSSAIGAAYLASVGLARLIERPRPCDRGACPLIPCPDGGSFPSDQTAAAFAAARILGWFQPSAAAWLHGAASAVAIARVAARVHYPSDVILQVQRSAPPRVERRRRSERAERAQPNIEADREHKDARRGTTRGWKRTIDARGGALGAGSPVDRCSPG